ncbi:hypothetical protein V9K67_16220 [Paraflavisolibacter sp. H34]|uniref:hypothetical protein n=1 Tax=Huijunlia imazamoxiresistens TaxID=3127457 RepID=UPI0030198897
MIAKPKEQNIDLWEAWIDLLCPGSKAGTLYVIGDVLMSSDLVQPYFIKRQSPMDIPGVLVLEIVSNKIYDEAYVTEIMYAEELDDMEQYNVIKIYAGDELVKTIDDIERLY